MIYCALKENNFSGIQNYLSENNFSVQFSPIKKIYYNFARPVMPLFIRHFLQGIYNSKIIHLPDFIWTERVKIIHDEENWSNFSDTI